MSVRFPVVLLALSCALFSSACGGSSSETPPPLEPLPVNLHYDRASTALSGEVPMSETDAGTTTRASEEPSESAVPGPPARSTWGSERAVPEAPLK